MEKYKSTKKRLTINTNTNNNWYEHLHRCKKINHICKNAKFYLIEQIQ